MFYDLCRITNSDDIIGNILNDYATGTDSYVIANRHSRKDRNTASYPTVIAYSDWLCPFLTCITFLRVGAVAGRIDADVRSYEAIITDSNVCLVEDYQIDVCMETLAHTDVLAEVTIERLMNECVFICLAEKFLQEFVTLLKQGRVQLVILPTETS